MELIAMALIIGALVAAQFLLYEKYGFKNVSYTISMSASEVYENDELEIIEEIDNAKRLPLVWARSEISCSPELAFKGRRLVKNERDVQRGLISGIFVLRGYRKCRRVWRVRCEKRGIMTIDNATLTISDLFGLSKRAKVFRAFDSVRVLPIPADMGAGELSGDLFIGSMQVRRFVLPDPFSISSAREYTGREPMNRIHWAHTARTGNIMVYNNEYTTERRVMIILNMQRRESCGGSVPESALELLIKGAAFVLELCRRMSAEFSLAINSASTLIMPAESGDHTLDALRRLAELESDCGERIDELLRRLDLNEITDVMFITSYVSETAAEILSGLAMRGKCCKILTTGINEGEDIIPPTAEVLTIPRGKSGNEEGGEAV